MNKVLAAVAGHPVFAALRSSSVWILLLPAMLFLGLTDLALLKTMLQWCAFSVIIAGIGIIISMIVFPQLKLDKLVEQARTGCLASGVIVAALVLFVGILFYTLIFWAKT